MPPFVTCLKFLNKYNRHLLSHTVQTLTRNQLGSIPPVVLFYCQNKTNSVVLITLNSGMWGGSVPKAPVYNGGPVYIVYL